MPLQCMIYIAQVKQTFRWFENMVMVFIVGSIKGAKKTHSRICNKKKQWERLWLRICIMQFLDSKKFPGSILFSRMTVVWYIRSKIFPTAIFHTITNRNSKHDMFKYQIVTDEWIYFKKSLQSSHNLSGWKLSVDFPVCLKAYTSTMYMYMQCEMFVHFHQP